MLAWRKILCAVDFSDSSREAARVAATLAGRLGAELTLLHVVPVPAYPLPEGAIMLGASSMQANLDQADRELAAWAAEAERSEGVKPTVATAIGAASQEVVRYATEHATDLIVMGTHGRSGLPHLLLGSVAERVLRGSACPVLTIRGGKKATTAPFAGAVA